MKNREERDKKELEELKNPSLKTFKRANPLYQATGPLGIGYNRAEVDEFLTLISQTLVSSDEIDNKTFVSEFRGYIKEDVKFFLQEVVALRYAEEHKDEIEAKNQEKMVLIDLSQPNFRTLVSGYKKSEVDAFLQLIPTLSAKEIYEKNFHKQFRGYSLEDVDWYLDKVIQEKK